VPVAAPERRGAPRRRLGYGMVAVVLAAAAALGLAAAPTVRRPVSVRLTSRVATDGLSAAVPAGWAKSSATLAALRSLGLQRAIAMAPATAGAGDGVLLGWGSTATPRLLPDSFLAAFGSPPHAGEVRLGTQSALAYGPMSGGGAEVTVYVVPTSRGDATVACRSRRAGEVRRACDAIAQSLQLTGVTVFAPAPRAAYARAVERALQRMQRDEARQARRLAGARTAAGQAAALRPFAGIYGRAAAALGAIRTAPFERGPTAAVVTQLHRLQGDYAALAAAAAAGRRGRYAQARGAAQTARRRLSAATTALGSLGYTLTKGAT
jgi:hypothetical protein